ncbi:class I SAM-dependent methyltransferase [Streptomyces sp. NPDC059568]|uniref:class I SAM-dependent methyltransferase n=1 Tax=Streptomyces sp. NPDC059568 TaxID=3346868 RepID=UPI0036D1B814
MGENPRTATEQQLAAVYDAFHAARASTTLVAQLYAEAMGDAYPHELEASSSCDWPLLGAVVSRLRLCPGGRLVDLGCGTGGAGLWLARALSVHLVGIDISPTAISLATRRSPAFVPPGQATFRVATMEATGLPDAQADGVVCVDALGFAPDQRSALREMRRVLRPGGRAVLTSGGRRTHLVAPPWSHRAAEVGMELESEEVRPDEPAMWRRLYRLWTEHEADLRRHLGDEQAENMLTEARTRSPALGNRHSVTVTLRRPDGTQASADDPGPTELHHVHKRQGETGRCRPVLPSSGLDPGVPRSP